MNAPLDTRNKVHALWRRANLDYLRHEGQVRLTKKFRASKAKRFVVNWTRRGGKSYALVFLAIEYALRGKRVLYGTGEKDATRDIVEPIIAEVLEDCPPELYPKENLQRLIWRFPSGGRIQLVGLDGARNMRRRRGGEDDLVIVDEAGFLDNLRPVVESVLMARTMLTNGRIIISSTPPETPAHDFKGYWEVAEIHGDFDRMTLEEAPHIDSSTKETYIEEAGGRDSTICRREYFCEFVPDDARAVLPEFYRNKADLVVDLPVPEFRHYWVAADFGFSDMTVVVFAYLDFQRARIVVEDELAFQGVSGIEVGNAIKAKELALWGADARPTRIADAPAQLLADLASVCGVAFGPARKDDADAALNGLRMDCHRKILAVHPRCKVTISHLENAIWNTSRTSFARSEGLGHFDGVDAVKYLCRHIDRHANPFPPLYGIDPSRQNIPERLLAEHRARSLAGAFGR